MAEDIITKTISQAEEAADVQDDDWMLIQRGNAPAEKVRVAAYRTAIGEKLAEEFAGEDLETALDVAATVTANAALATLAADRADVAVDRAVLAAASTGAYPHSAATVVPRGVVSVVLTDGGTAYTDGVDFVGALTGGGGLGARFLFDVVAGEIVNIHGVEPGYGYTSPPVADFSASAGGTGDAAATVAIGHLVLSGRFYFAASADGASEQMFQNVAGVATVVDPPVVRAPTPQTLVRLVQTNDSATLWELEPAPGYAVPANPMTALFDYTATAANPPGSGIVIKGAGFLGAEGRQLVRPDGVQIVGGVIQPGLRTQFHYAPSGKFNLMTPSAGPASAMVDTQMLSSTGVLWVMHPVQTLMNNTGIGIFFTVYDPPVRTEGGLYGRMIGINDAEDLEIRGYSGEPGDEFPQDLIDGPNWRVVITRNENGAYQLVSAVRPGLPIPPPPPAGSFSAFATRAAAAARALSTFGY